MELLFTFVMAASVASGMARVPFSGTCPTQAVQQNFDVNQYKGIWYENRNYPEVFQALQSCVTATYSVVADIPNGIKVVNAGGIFLLGKYIPVSVTGKAVLTEPSANPLEAKLRVSFNKGDSGTDANYLVLKTDYTSYSIVWGCSDYRIAGRNFNKQSLWILTRERNAPDSVVQTALAEIANRQLDSDKLRETYQSATECATPPAEET